MLHVEPGLHRSASTWWVSQLISKVWCSDALDSNLPYQQKTKSGSVVVIPWSDFVDNRTLRASPRVYFEVYKEMFDYLHACEPGARTSRMSEGSRD